MTWLIRQILKLNTRVGGTGFYPIPPWLRQYLNRMSMPKRVVYYARLCSGVDLSTLAPNEVGCAESVTRLLRQLDTTLVPVELSTYRLTLHLVVSKRFVELDTPLPGCVVIAATGTGNGHIVGHTGIYDGRRIWNNNSYTGKWSDSYTIATFRDRYERLGGMKVRFFIPVR